MSEPTDEIPLTLDVPGRTADPNNPTLLRPDEGQAEAGGSTSTSGRYTLVEEIARGGMGVVYRATDSVLNRDVAVKVLHVRYAVGTAVANRFVDEARITGQLQHPGIPAVHDLGTLADDRPFLAMKLVKGRTLDTLLRERSDATVDRGRFIAAFEQVCHAVAYAHEHRVIHRDLKPANVMVGSFGEVQVMDWGLAKVLTAKDEFGRSEVDAPPATQIQTPHDTDAGVTQAGSILGTPAFMPPEQAIGAIDQIDERSDVFGLGAILCTILTGEPPYRGGDVEATRQLAARGKLDDAIARLESCQAHADLIALCRRCMSVEKSDRPANAAEVAKAVANFRAAADDRARQAELDRVAAETEAREQRKRRRVQLVLAAIVVGFFVLLGAIAWRVRADRLAREAEEAGEQFAAEERVRAVDDEAQRLATQREWPAALVAIRRAVDLTHAGRVGDSLRELIDKHAASIEAEHAAAERDKRLTVALLEASFVDERITSDQEENKRIQPSPETTAESRYRQAFLDCGLDIETRPDEALRFFANRPEAVRLDVAAGLDGWAYHRRERDDVAGAAQLIALADKLDLDPDRKRLRDLIGNGKLRHERIIRETTEAFMPLRSLVPNAPSNELKLLRRLAADPATAQSSVYNILLVITGLHEAGDLETALAMAKAGRQFRPDSLILAYMEAAVYLKRQPPALLEALAPLQVARAIRPESGLLLMITLLNLKRVDEAIALAHDLRRRQPDSPTVTRILAFALLFNDRAPESEELLREVVAKHPNRAHPRHHLGLALFVQERWDEAAKEFQAAATLNPNDGEIFKHLGHCLMKLEQYQEAEAAYREALRLKPSEVELYNNIGALLFDQNRYAEAEKEFRTAIRHHPGKAMFHDNLGNVLRLQKRWDEAEQSYREAMRLEPKTFASYYHLARMQVKRNQFAAAEAVLRLAKQNMPGNTEVLFEFSQFYFDNERFDQAEVIYREILRISSNEPDVLINMGTVNFRREKWKEAEEFFRQSASLKPSRTAYYNLGNALWVQNRRQEAAASYRAAAALDPKHAGTQRNLGQVLGELRRWSEAEKAFREALRLGADAFAIYKGLYQSLLEQGREPEAIRELRNYVAQSPDAGVRHYTLGTLLLNHKHYADAEKALRDTLRLKYSEAETHCNLAHAIRGQGRFADSVPLFRRGHELGQKRADWKYPSAKWLNEAERLAKMESRLPALVRGSESISATELPDLVSVCSAKHHNAHGASIAAKVAFSTHDIPAGVQYDIACLAALAAAGKDAERTELSVEEWGRFTDLAYHCLRAAFVLRAKIADDPMQRESIRKALAHWQGDADLMAVREAKWLAAMPEADRKRWVEFWGDVQKMIDNLIASSKPEK